MPDTWFVKMLGKHVGHDVEIVNYGGVNITLECNDCGCVICDSDVYDLVGLSEEE